jgi:hypothetical protein
LKVKGGGERRRSSVGEKISLRVSAKERVGVAVEMNQDACHAAAVEEGCGGAVGVGEGLAAGVRAE